MATSGMILAGIMLSAWRLFNNFGNDNAPRIPVQGFFGFQHWLVIA